MENRFSFSASKRQAQQTWQRIVASITHKLNASIIQLFYEKSLKAFYLCCVLVKLFAIRFQGCRHSNDGRDIFGSSPEPKLLSTTISIWNNYGSFTNIQETNALRTVKFVRRRR
ncbi:hypothetical protein SDC9_201328 [bioreactor metagenome]|uniref:Uncharacterized protein n=1 Tax=bioreactor metagenome TaxID=1076179 RepID=A0A645IZJ2_9ZZZZ